MKKFDKTKIVYCFLAAFLIGLFLFFSYSRVFDDFELSTLDLRYKLRPERKADENIIIIQVADDTIEQLGEWPITRNYHELLVKALRSAGAKAIIFDVFFSEEKPEDEGFAEAVEDAGNVYIPYVLDIERDNPDKSQIYASGYAAPLVGILRDTAKGTGYVNVNPDVDGKVRKVPAFIRYQGKAYPQIAVLVALNSLGYDFYETEIIPGKRMVVDEDFIIPLDKNSSIIVDYPAPWGKAFRHYSYLDILQSYIADLQGKEPWIDLKEFKDSICFIGITASGSPDANPSPLEPYYPGVGVHASVYDGIIRGKYIVRLNKWWNLLILVVMWCITGYLTLKSHKRFSVLYIILLISIFIAIAIFAFWPFGVWIDVFYPVVTMGTIYVIFTFKKYITEMQKREVIEKELNIAKNIQQSFLPKDIPEIGNSEVKVKMVTARQVGGDLYDILKLDDNRLGIMIGDVSGKGVPAALYMARVVSVFKTFVKDGNPDEILKNVNDRLVNEAESSLFVTLTYTVFDFKNRKVKFAIGGHMPTVLVEPDGNVEALDVDMGMPLGMIESDFSIEEREYKPGSIFIFYTDGVTEAMNPKGEMLGQERLEKMAKNMKDKSPEEIVETIHKVIAAYEAGHQHDDITVMVVKT